MEPRDWCPLAGDNPELFAPLGARRQEGESLHHEGGAEQREISCCCLADAYVQSDLQ